MMTKKQMVRIGVITSLALVAIVYFVFLQHQLTEQENTTETVMQPVVDHINIEEYKEKEKSLTTLIKGVSVASNSRKPPEIIWHDYLQASNAQKAQSVISNAYRDGYDSLASRLELGLYARCNSTYQEQAMHEKDTDWIRNSVTKFCEGYTEVMSHEEFYSRFLRSNGETVKKGNELINKLRSLDESEIFNTVASQIANARSPEAMSNIGENLFHFLKDNPKLSLLQLEYPYISAGIIFEDVYFAAIDLYNCSKFGGCGSGELKVIRYCSISGQCQPDWSLYDFYENILSLNDMENVLIILQHILNQKTYG